MKFQQFTVIVLYALLISHSHQCARIVEHTHIKAAEERLPAQVCRIAQQDGHNVALVGRHFLLAEYAAFNVVVEHEAELLYKFIRFHAVFQRTGEHDALVPFESAASTADSETRRVHIVHVEITVAVSTPSPVYVEKIVGVVSVDHESVSAILAGAAIDNRASLLQLVGDYFCEFRSLAPAAVYRARRVAEVVFKSRCVAID